MGGAMGKLAGLSNKKMKKMFEKYDADKSGTVSFEELLVMLEEEKLGHENQKDNVQFLTDYLIESMADEDGDGQLDFKEFTTFCKAAKKEKKEEHKKLQGMTEPQLREFTFRVPGATSLPTMPKATAPRPCWTRNMAWQGHQGYCRAKNTIGNFGCQ